MSNLQTVHEFDHNGKHYRFVWDELHETVGSYGLDTPEETKAAEDEELANLRSGKWVALGCIMRTPKPCPRAEHCECCPKDKQFEEDSLWGIVIENDARAWEQFVKDGGL